MTGILYSWVRFIFQYQTMRKSSIELGLVYKTFVNKHTWKTLLLPPEKKNMQSTDYVTLGSSWSWTRLSFPHIQKHTLETFFPSESRAVLPEHLALAPVHAYRNAQKYSVIRPNSFVKLCPCLAWESNSNSINNSECMKQHCTAPLIFFLFFRKVENKVIFITKAL